MRKSLILTAILASSLSASGYKIPEQSVESVARAAANVAYNTGADMSYYNPASMAFSKENHLFQANFTLVQLSQINFDGTVSTQPLDTDSKEFREFIPTVHYVGKDHDGLRFGLSVTAPGGLSKMWNEGAAKTYAEEFTLRIVEVNPTVAYRLSDDLAIGGGLRMIVSDGIVKSSGTIVAGMANPTTPLYTDIVRDMSGECITFGYNLALAYKPLPKLNLAWTYRSNVDLKEEGDAKLSSSTGYVIAGGTKVEQPTALPAGSYDDGASVQVPLPAVMSFAGSYDFGNTVIEAVVERIYWSSYEDLDFKYDSAVTHPVLKSAFDDPKDRDWEDTTTYRLSVVHQLNDETRLMAGYAYDPTPAPEKTLGFELPDSDAHIYSLGATFAMSENMDVGVAYLLSSKEDRKVNGSKNESNIDGEFTNSHAQLFSFGINYKY